MKNLNEFNVFMDVKKNLSQNTLRSYDRIISNMLNYFNVENIDQYNKLSLLDFEKYLNTVFDNPNQTMSKYKDNEKLRNNSYNTTLCILKVFANWLCERNFSEENPLKKLKYKKKQRINVISLREEEREAMIRAAKGLDQKIRVGLMAWLGLRRFELMDIKTSDIIDGHLVFEGKGDKEAKLEIPPFLLEMIQEYLSTRDFESEYLLVSKVGKNKLTNGTSIYNNIKKIARDAGIPESKLHLVAPHTLRRTFACRAVENGTSPYVVKDMMRHSSIHTTNLYLEAMGIESANTAIRNQPVPNWR